MIPISLTLTNFGSFKGTQVFEFPKVPGLYSMQGVNLAEPRLEGNGTGKTTLWKALTWLAFGKTSAGLKAGDVCNWDVGKGAEVELAYTLQGDRDYNGSLACVWYCRRTWSPNSWTLSHVAEFIGDEEVIDLTKAESNAFLNDLGLTFTPFLNCVLTAQRAPMFLDLGGDAQAGLFSDVLGLDKWLDYSVKASKKASAQDAISRSLERDLAGVEGQLEGLGKQDFRLSIDGWEAKRKTRLAELAEKHAELSDAARGFKLRLEEAKDDETYARGKLRDAQPDARRLTDYQRAQAEVSDYAMLIREDQKRLTRLKKEAEEVKSDKTCSTCGQPLDPRHRAELQHKLAKAMLTISDQIKKYEREMLGAEAQSARLGGDLEGTQEIARKATADLDDAIRTTTQARRAFEMNERDLDHIEDQAEGIEREANPYLAMEEKARKEGASLRAECEALKARLDESNARCSLYSYWVRGFKELRLEQIAEALTELEIEVNSCVTALGLVDWELIFQVDRVTKGGSVSKGFDVFVRSPHNERAVPWAVWSGGEGQRLRIAGTMGLANLIRNRTGASIDLEVWDEPTQGLSPQGVRDLLEMLATRARTEKRQIWIIDHTARGFGGFAGGAIITKDKDGSTIAQH